MSLVVENPKVSFDMSQIKRGYLLWGKRAAWSEGKSGFVTAATEDQLIVHYFPGIGNVTNHFIIPVAEAAAGKWEIRWSSDMAEVQEYGIKAGGGQSDEEGDGEDDSGGIDI